MIRKVKYRLLTTMLASWDIKWTLGRIQNTYLKSILLILMLWLATNLWAKCFLRVKLEDFRTTQV